MSVGILQLLVSSLVAGVVPVMSDKTAQLRVSCQYVCRDLMCIDTQWFATALELLMPWMEECVWVLDNLRRCTHLSVMKCDCSALSRSALRGIYRLELFRNSTIAVASNIWFCGLPLNVQYVLISVMAMSGSFIVNLLLVDDPLPVIGELLFIDLAS